MTKAPVSAVFVSRADERDGLEWDSFVNAARESTFFHRFAWRGLLRHELGAEDHYLVARRDALLVGVLPLMLVRSRLFGSSLTSLPFCSYAGPLALDKTTENVLIQASIDLAKRLGADRLEIRGLRPFVSTAPRQTLYSTFRGPIPRDVENLNGIPQKRRNAVRRALKLKLRSDVGRDADRFYELFAENARAHGTPALGRRIFRSLPDLFPNDCDILFVSDVRGRDQSAIVSFYHHGEALAYFAGEVPAAMTNNANDFKYWALMMHARGRGCTRFDFGRSKLGSGSFWFKQHWGFNPLQLHYEFPYLPSGRVPENNPNNPRFRAAITVWRRLPRVLTDRLGPVLVSGLG